MSSPAATPHNINLAGQTALITGSTSGIGSAIAHTLASQGTHLQLFARNTQKLTATTTALQHRYPQITVQMYVVDVTDQVGVERCVVQAAQEAPSGRIDILINNAGLALGAPHKFWQQPITDITTVLHTNIDGVVYMTHAVLRHSMLQDADKDDSDGRGTIVNISSITGLVAPLDIGGEAAYHTTKAAMEGFNNVLRNELSQTNIKLLTIRPGFVGGGSAFHSTRHGGSDNMKAKTFEGMEELQPGDVADALVYMLLQPERVSIRSLDIVPTAQRSLYVNDRTWNDRNGIKT